jgi:ribosomal protein S13
MYVLEHTPGLRAKGAENVLRKARVWPRKRVADLTNAEKEVINRFLPPRVRRRQSELRREPGA